MAKIYEKTTGITESPGVTFSHTLQGAAVAIAKNREGTQCVVGGRNLLKIFSIEGKRFVEKTNLVYGPRKLNYSFSDVQWHPLEDNIIASAAGNGAVILWDLNKDQKQDHIFTHDRFVNRINFHPTEVNWLLSCSQDGNTNCIDIRKKEVTITFCGKSDSVRDVQFHPVDRNIFCAAGESGNVQLWDMRKPDHYYTQFTAHTGPVFAVNWHLEDRYLIATGGRDEFIKIWDTQASHHPMHVIETIASVNRIKWRPNHKYHIASCALLLDNNINIWDIRRPYVPLAAFQEHTNVATGFVWHGKSLCMLSCSKDKTIIHHALHDAERPAEKAPPVGMGVSPNGTISHAFRADDTKTKPFKMNTLRRITSSSQQLLLKKQSSLMLDVIQEFSTVNIYHTNHFFDEKWIGTLAAEYEFYGKPLPLLCEHNALVSSRLGMNAKAQTWTIIGQLYYNVASSLPSPLSIQHNSDHFNRKLETPEITMNDGTSNIESSASSDNEIESAGLRTPIAFTNMNDTTLVGPELDAVFVDDECTAGQLFSTEADEEGYSVPREAITLRHSFGERAFQSNETEDEETEKKEEVVKEPSSLAIPEWDHREIIKEMLIHYAEQGDLQMAVTVLLVLDQQSEGLIEPEVQEDWFYGYLEILSRLNLFNIATEIINHAPSPVQNINQNSTVVHMNCGNCGQVLGGTSHGWYCRSCKKCAQVCAICHIPVKGLYAWCQGCGHGGHISHLKKWYSKYKFCPTGCGHKCEYS